jgi:DNA-binding beta-propeller fold protein YncE
MSKNAPRGRKIPTPAPFLLASSLTLGLAGCGAGDDPSGPVPHPVIRERAEWAETAAEPYLTDHSSELLASIGEGSGALSLAKVFSTPRNTLNWKKAAAEIVAINKQTGRVFSVNSQMEFINYYRLAEDGSLTEPGVLEVGTDVPNHNGINSISIADGVMAVALEMLDDSPVPIQIAGRCAFYDVSGAVPVFLGAVKVGALPDAVTMTPDGKKALLANEGEPPLMDSGENFDYANDPEGSISIVTRPEDGWGEVSDADVKNLDFRDFDDGGSRADERPPEIHRLAPADPAQPNGAVSRWSQQFEPEFIGVTPDSDQAWAVLQEQNTVAVVDLTTDSIEKLVYLGEKDGLLPGNEFDASHLDEVRLASWPVYLMYQPDTIRSYRAPDGNVYYVTANEGDPRTEDWTWDETEKIGALELDPRWFPGQDAGWLSDDLLGALRVTTTRGDDDGDGLFEHLYAFGGRSFTIWNQDGEVVFDSGNQLEIITANKFGTSFNNDSATINPQYDSPWKGPEPEPLVLGVIEVNGEPRSYAFVGSEKMGGIWIYDITEPARSEYVTYFNNRNPELNPRDDVEADLATEGMDFISAEESPSGTPMLVLGNETSGTVSVYEISVP